MKFGELHRLIGSYLGDDHRMPNCGQVMRGTMQCNDAVLEEPPSGQGTNFIIRYFLPRK